MQNNRSLEDQRFDEIDHALGRPNNPCFETSRNFFGVEVGSAKAKELQADPYWQHTRDFAGTSGFIVSEAGKVALAEYLKDNWTPPKRYDVTWAGITQTVTADKPGQAKYQLWLDCEFTDLPFGDFVKAATARVAQQ